jgi:hypothetical protein
MVSCGKGTVESPQQMPRTAPCGRAICPRVDKSIGSMDKISEELCNMIAHHLAPQSTVCGLG